MNLIQLGRCFVVVCVDLCPDAPCVFFLFFSLCNERVIGGCQEDREMGESRVFHK